MILHYLKIAWRNLLKDRVYSAVNILGLAIAMTFCFLLIFWIRFELSYETGHPDVDRIYKILEEETRTDGINYNGWIRPGFSAKIKEVFPQVK
ncbi:MAG: ABC transporter permease, partial [Bacteroidales bacterium]|nr:ABC transporter permease [Bacteroidales bacterium]